MARKAKEFIDKIKDEFENVVIETDEKVEAIPTGAYSLDICTGILGIPKGRFTEIYGPESTGKTTLTLNICKTAIEKNLKVFYVDIEQTLDYPYIKSIVGNVDNFILVKPRFAEDAFKLMEEAIDNGEYSLVVLDSVGALSPKKEIEDEFEDANIALVPRLLAKFLRRNAFTVREKNISVIFINQVRANIKSYMASYSTPGGHAIKHYASLIVALTKGKEITQAGNPVGLNVKFAIKKNKVSSVQMKGGLIPIYYNKGVSSSRDLLQFAEMLGAIEKTSGNYYMFGGIKLGHGFSESAEIVEKDKELLDKIVKACYNMSDSLIQLEEEEDENGEDS